MWHLECFRILEVNIKHISVPVLSYLIEVKLLQAAHNLPNIIQYLITSFLENRNLIRQIWRNLSHSDRTLHRLLKLI